MTAVRALAIATILVCCSCQRDAEIVSAEVSVIPFDASTAVRQTDGAVKKWPKTTALNSNQMSVLREALAQSCTPAKYKPDELDLRFYAVVTTAENKFVWKASWFAFFDSRSNLTCEMPSQLRNTLKNAFPYEYRIRT